MQASCLLQRGSIRSTILNRPLACNHPASHQRTRSILLKQQDVHTRSKSMRFLSTITGNGRSSKRQLLCRLAPGLWVYNNGGIYGGEAAVAVNQTTQQVIMQRSGVATLNSASFAGSVPTRARGVQQIMNHLSERMVKGTAQILSKPQPRTSTLQEAGRHGFCHSAPQPHTTHHPHFPSPLTTPSSQRRQYITSTNHLNKTTSTLAPASVSRTAHLSSFIRTKLAPSTVRSHAINESRRTYATQSSNSSALVKYTPPTGPLDRVGRAKLLSAAPTFLARLKIRFKLLLMRQIRPWRVDDFIAMFSWAFLANVAFVLLGTTTFFSLVLAAANSLQFQGFVASKISNYLTASTGVKVKFEAAIVPNWKDGRITLRNVVMSKRAEIPATDDESSSLVHKGEDHSGHGHEHDDSHPHIPTEEEIDTNFTMFDVTIDQIDVTLSAKRWLDGKGLIEDASIKGVRGVIDRTHVWWDPDVEYIPEEARRKHVPGDFELESLQLEDMLVTVLQPDGFRPYTVSVFSAQFPCFRKQWICYDMLCADSMVGMFDGCLFSCYTAQRENTDTQTDTKWKRTTRFKIDDVKIDHLNAGVEGPFGWIYAGTVDITCDVKIPNEPEEDVLRKLVNDIVDKIDEVVDFAPLPLVFGTGAIGGKEIIVYPNRAAAALHQRMMEKEEEEREMLALQRRQHGHTQQVQTPQDEHHRLHKLNKQHQKVEQQYRQYQLQQQQSQQHLTEHQRQQHQQHMSRLNPATITGKTKSKKPALVMDFEFRFNDTKASIPLQTESMSYLSNAMVRPLVAFMNSNRTVTPIRCRVEMDLSEFDGSWTIYDSNLMNNLSTEVGKAWANLVADERERNRKLKRVGLWGLQSMTRNIVSVYDYARGNRGFWHYIGTQSPSPPPAPCNQSADISHAACWLILRHGLGINSQPYYIRPTPLIKLRHSVSTLHKQWPHAPPPRQLNRFGKRGQRHLFQRRFESGPYRFVDKWDPKPLLRAGAVCRLWHSVLTPVLWQTYDLATMEKKVPLDVLARNISLVRNLSLLDKKHKKHGILWSSIIQHAHIDRLEIHDAVFPVKKLIGQYNHTLVNLNLSGNCERMHPFLLIFVEHQAHLLSLELTRFQFTASDWKSIITNKPNLCKLVISWQCEFLDHKTFDDPAADNKGDKRDERKDRQNEIKAEIKDRKGEQPTDMDVDSTSGPNNNSHRGNNCTNTATTSKGPRRSPRKNRAKLVNQDLVNARDIGILLITHLVLRDNRLLRPFQKSILEACPHLEQLEICYLQKADGGKVATLARENCPNIRRLTLHSIRQPWTLAMINGMPKSVEELILFTGKLDLQMAMAIKKRKDTLTKLEFDFGRGSKGKCRLACILSILRKCTELHEFAYHNHAADRIFKAMMFKNSWNLPNLRKLHLHGVSPRAKYGGIAQVTSPEGWRQVYGGRQHCCCSARSFEEVRKQGRGLKSPLFDVALLNHVEDLPILSEVVITEAVYRKRLD